MSSILLVNFGGPRSLEEIPSFLTALLTDRDVIRTPFPRFFEKWFFKRIALQRAEKIKKDYRKIGGKSPIYEDTEYLAEQLRKRTGLRVITFHRYLTATHEESLKEIERAEDLIVLPLFPQFSFATTGSIARFFQENLSSCEKLRWIQSYPTQEKYVGAMVQCLRDFLQEKGLNETDTVLFFSAHGLPQEFVDQGDPYEEECNTTYEAIRKEFPQAHSFLAFQSKFGPGEWLRPYTNELCEKPETWIRGRKNVVFVPLSFTSDHIETLFEIEEMYLRTLREKGWAAYRCPALNRRDDWIEALVSLVQQANLVGNRTLVRHS